MTSRRAPRRVPSAGLWAASLTLLGLAAAALTAGCPSEPVPVVEHVCPNGVPELGSPCSQAGLACSYANTTGCTVFFVASCEADGT